MTGAWAAILFIGNEKITLSGIETNTTHNRMELMAVLNALDYLVKTGNKKPIHIYTDSQYVALITERKDKLISAGFITKKGTDVRNADLVNRLIQYIENDSITFIKVKAHQKSNGDENINREVDILVRQILRKQVKT